MNEFRDENGGVGVLGDRCREIPEYLMELAAEIPVSGADPLQAFNHGVYRRTGLREFFPRIELLDHFRHNPQSFLANDLQHHERQWGDFQTPLWLARDICALLARTGIAPRIIVEPTFGAGSFIRAAMDAFPSAQLLYGVEIQEKYEWELKLHLAARSVAPVAQPDGIHAASAAMTTAAARSAIAPEIELHRDDIFTHTFPEYITGADDILVLGNPPWVTNAELGSLSSGNRPARQNLRALRGLDALTGKSNFDICEPVILRMLELFAARRGWLAMLCKNGVARNIVEMLPARGFRCTDVRAYTIDTARAFGVGVGAALLVMRLGEAAGEPPGESSEESTGRQICRMAAFDTPERNVRTYGWAGKKFVADLDLYREHAFLDGASPLVWRQGIKHDCARVMELRREHGQLVNGMGEPAIIEAGRHYPLLKCSDLRSFVPRGARREVIVTQSAIGEDTELLRDTAPLLWAYLQGHREQLADRRSSIYRKAPEFALFGIGEYSFKPYKVGISGLYKRPFFSLIPPFDGRPAMLADTCYFLGFDALPDALFTAALLNHPIVLGFLDSIIFPEAKRPYTKQALMRIDLAEAAARTPFDALRSIWISHGYEAPEEITGEEYERYRGWLVVGS